MLVCCTTEETGFSSCRLTKVLVSRLAVLASVACLFGVRLGKLIFPVVEDIDLLTFVVVVSFSFSQHACYLRLV